MYVASMHIYVAKHINIIPHYSLDGRAIHYGLMKAVEAPRPSSARLQGLLPPTRRAASFQPLRREWIAQNGRRTLGNLQRWR